MLNINALSLIKCSIINTSEDMSKVKVFVTDGQTDKGTDRQTDGPMRFNVPMLSRKWGTKMKKTCILVPVCPIQCSSELGHI